MLQLRAQIPSDLTGPLLAVLEASADVSAIAVDRGSSIRPPGDVVTADLTREGANAVIEDVRRLGVAWRGTLHVTPVPTWVSGAGLQAERQAPGSSADAVVWVEVGNRAYAESELNWTYLSFMVMATLLAGIAIILDSQILTIGAMVLGPKFAPIAAIGLALVRRRPRLLRLAARTLVLGFLVAILTTTLVTLAGRGLGWVEVADLQRRALTNFIYHPDKWSVVVAILAGAAGVLSLTSARTGGLSGVFISVTTIPAAGNIGLGMAFGAWDEVRGSALQLTINLVAMIVAGWATLAVQQVIWRRTKVKRPEHIGRPPLEYPPPAEAPSD